MSVLNLDLGGSSSTTIDGSDAQSGDTLNITALGSHTLIVEDVDVTVTSFAGVVAGSQPTFIAGTHGSIGIDLGLLNLGLLNDIHFEMRDNGQMSLDASTVSALGGLSRMDVTYTGNHVATFSYTPSTVAVLDTVTFNVTDMQAGDQFIIDGGRSFALDTVGFLGGPTTAYRDGVLYLKSTAPLGGLLTQNVRVEVPMTQAEADLFFANRATYLDGGIFTFPGTPLCYADDALILTDRGYRPVQDLRAGDRLRCADGRLRPLVWVAATRLDAGALDLRPDLRPVRIARGALGPDYPFADLVVSPQHRVFVNGPGVRAETGQPGGLIAIKHLVGLPGISTDPAPAGVTWHHLLLDGHEVIVANGILSESLHLGPWSMRQLDAQARLSLLAVLPGFAAQMAGGATSRYPLFTGQTARRVLRAEGARAGAFVAPGQLRSSLAACREREVA